MTYSQSVLVFADRLIQKSGGILNSYTHPGGQKVPIKPLSHLLITASLAYLIDQGLVTLEIKTTKTLFLISHQTPFVTKLTTGQTIPLATIDSRLYEAISSTIPLKQAVFNILKENDEFPWGQIVAMARQDLVDQGILIPQMGKRLISYVKGYHFATSPSQSEYDRLKQVLSNFDHQPDYVLIQKAIVSGLSSRRESSGSDND